MLDEVMVSVTCGEVGPLVTGVVYCSVLGACHELFDLSARRSGRRRSPRGARASRHAARIRGRVSRAPRPRSAVAGGLGGGARRSGTRLRGRRIRAEQFARSAMSLYRISGGVAPPARSIPEGGRYSAARAGGPQLTGLALLRLAQGQVETADVAIRHELPRATGSGPENATRVLRGARREYCWRRKGCR